MATFANPWLPPVVESGTSFTIGAEHLGRIVKCTNAALVTVTFPLDAAEFIPPGAVVTLHALGAGGVTVSYAGSILGNAPNDTIDQNDAMDVYKDDAADTIGVIGGRST